MSRVEILVTTGVENDEVPDRLDADRKVYPVGLGEAPNPATQVAAAPQQGSVQEPVAEPVTKPVAESVAEPLTSQEQLAAVRLFHVVEVVDIIAAA